MFFQDFIFFKLFLIIKSLKFIILLHRSTVNQINDYVQLYNILFIFIHIKCSYISYFFKVLHFILIINRKSILPIIYIIRFLRSSLKVIYVTKLFLYFSLLLYLHFITNFYFKFLIYYFQDYLINL